MNDESRDRPGEADDLPDVEAPFRYHLELTPAQLKITHTALRSLLDDFGHNEPEILDLIREVLSKLPDEHAIRAIHLDRELERQPPPEDEGPSNRDGRPPPAA